MFDILSILKIQIRLIQLLSRPFKCPIKALKRKEHLLKITDNSKRNPTGNSTMVTISV